MQGLCISAATALCIGYPGLPRQRLSVSVAAKNLGSGTRINLNCCLAANRGMSLSMGISALCRLSGNIFRFMHFTSIRKWNIQTGLSSPWFHRSVYTAAYTIYIVCVGKCRIMKILIYGTNVRSPRIRKEPFCSHRCRDISALDLITLHDRMQI